MSTNQEKDMKYLLKTQGYSEEKKKMSNLFKGLIAGQKNQIQKN